MSENNANTRELADAVVSLRLNGILSGSTNLPKIKRTNLALFEEHRAIAVKKGAREGDALLKRFDRTIRFIRANDAVAWDCA